MQSALHLLQKGLQYSWHCICMSLGGNFHSCQTGGRGGPGVLEVVFCCLLHEGSACKFLRQFVALQMGWTFYQSPMMHVCLHALSAFLLLMRAWVQAFRVLETLEWLSVHVRAYN